LTCRHLSHFLEIKIYIEKLIEEKYQSWRTFGNNIYVRIDVKKSKNILRLIYKTIALSFLCIFILSSCSSKKRKGGGEPSKLSKFYHNTTALYNGYFNANEILEDTYIQLKDQHQDNYTEILPLYDYVSINDPKSVAAELDRAIEKVTTVAALHEPSKWVDDCYVLMGEAQYLKQEYETAEETFAYFKDEFNPTNPFGRNYAKKKKSKKAIKKEREAEKKEEKKKRDEEKKADKKQKEEEREIKKKEREAKDKARKEEREAKKKAREEEKKRRNKKKKKRSKGKKRRVKKEASPEEDVPKTTEPTKKVETKNTEDVPAVDNTPKEPYEREEESTVDSESKKKKEEKKKKDKTAYSKGMMWYAKALVQREKYSNASYIVKRLKEEDKMPKEARREAPVILADINIKEENYALAIDYLDEAIELASDKNLKARYAFVQGQLYQKLNDFGNSSNAFANAKKWSNKFEMEFMAELNNEKTQMMAGTKTDQNVISKLDKMIKEEKYAEYLDQVYYTKGEILLANDQFEEALKSFSRSIANNTSNIALKQETYYKLAKLFYNKEAYVESKNYYDSTLTVLDKEDARYREVSNYANNLTDVALNLETIKLQDSLLDMATWSDEKIQDLAEKLIEESEKAALAVDDKGNNAAASNKSVGAGLKRSSFFAYDVSAKQRGQKAFKETWGDIDLADNWRRSDKSDIFGSDEIETETEVAEDGFSEDQIGQMISSIKSQIPYSDKAKSEINTKLETAFFELGKAFRDKIQNYERAAEAHSELMRRYPDFEKKLDAYYYLYLSYLDLDNSVKANLYKEKILSQFPDSQFAKAISDPNFAASNLTQEEKLNKFYKETYELFEKGDYDNALLKAEQSDDIFGKKNALRPKFALVKAMATGSVHGKEKYIKSLQDVITRFPNTPEKARANEILRFLQGDDDAFTGVTAEEVDDLFSVEENKLHYVAVVMYDTSPDKLVNAKISVSNYNKEYHKLKKLQLGDSPLDRKKNMEVILVRRFENQEKAMKYYEEVMGSLEEFIPSEIGAYAVYPITQRNYRKMIIERSDVRYKLFFEKNYLGQ